MANLAWTQKYRPKILEEYIGNDALKGRVTKLLELNKLPQMVLLQGSPGTGKTTMARLFAKALLCERPVNGKACGGCTTCQRMDAEYIETGKAPRGVPVTEYDITNTNRREDAEAIVSRMKQRTLTETRKVFILDEVQRATKEAQSSFLKITEEPVEGLYVILCTTDPQDLLDAIRSRFHQFYVKKPTSEELANRLATICQLEGVNYTVEGLKLLSEKAGRTPRDTLNLAEVVSATSPNLKRESVQKELEIISEKIFSTFLMVCKKGKIHEVTKLTAVLEEKNIEIRAFVEGLGDYIVQLLNVRAGIQLDRYDAIQVRDMRALLRGIEDTDMVKVLKVLKTYIGMKQSAGFLMYTLAVEVMSALQTEEKAVNVNNEKAQTRYKEVTKQTRARHTNRQPTPATSSDVEAIFQGAKQVRGG